MDNTRLLNKDTFIILLISEAFHMLASPLLSPSKDAPATTIIFLMHVSCAFVVHLFNPLLPYT